MFGKDPGKFYANMTVRIGRFGKTDDDLKFEESVEGNLIHCLREVPAQLNHKFFIKPIDFEGLQRIEKGEYPVAALREMLLNSLVHRDYMGSNIQIRMYDDRFCIWNEGFLPDVCFKGGYIDAWGRGILKMLNACKQAGLPEPGIKEQDGGLLVTLFKDRYTDEQLLKLGLNDRQSNAVKYVKIHGQISNQVYQDINKTTKRTASRDLTDLVFRGIFQKSGVTGKGTLYVLTGFLNGSGFSDGSGYGSGSGSGSGFRDGSGQG